MKLSIKARVNKDTEQRITFWFGKDPLNPGNSQALAVKRGIFTSFYSFPEAENFDSIGIIRKASHKNGELTVFLDLEVSSEKELQDLHNFNSYIDQLPEEYRTDLRLPQQRRQHQSQRPSQFPSSLRLRGGYRVSC